MILTIFLIILLISYIGDTRRDAWRYEEAKRKGELVYMTCRKSKWYLVHDRFKRVIISDGWVCDLKGKQLFNLKAHCYDVELKKMKQSNKRYYVPDKSKISNLYIDKNKILARREDDMFVIIKQLNDGTGRYKEIELKLGDLTTDFEIRRELNSYSRYFVEETSNIKIYNKEDYSVFHSDVLK